MGQMTKKFNEDTIQEMKQFYNDLSETPPQGAIFRARTTHAVITAYKSGKVLFQGTNPEIEINKWEAKKMPSNKSEHKTDKIESEFKPPPSLFQANHIGSDESGTGDYFGPITCCAVYVQKEQIKLLTEIGIQDSKLISDNNIKRLAKELIELRIPYSLMILHNEKYNDLQKKGWSQGKMKAMLHHSVIEQLIRKIGSTSYDGIIIDQFCNPPIYKNHLVKEGKRLKEKTYFMTKAENHSIAVAAASIIARASFVKEMDKLSETVGIELMKGASAKVDQIAARIIREKGDGILSKIAKVHFANTKKAKQYL